MVYSFRKSHNQLQQVIVRVLRPTKTIIDSNDADAIKVVTQHYFITIPYCVSILDTRVSNTRVYKLISFIHIWQLTISISNKIVNNVWCNGIILIIHLLLFYWTQYSIIIYTLNLYLQLSFYIIQLTTGPSTYNVVQSLTGG